MDFRGVMAIFFEITLFFDSPCMLITMFILPLSSRWSHGEERIQGINIPPLPAATGSIGIGGVAQGCRGHRGGGGGGGDEEELCIPPTNKLANPQLQFFWIPQKLYF